MCIHFSEVIQSAEFYQLTLAEVIDFIKDDRINIPNSDPILKGCMKWVQFNTESRTDQLADLLNHVQVDQCSFPCLNNITTQYEDIIDQGNVRKRFYKAVFSIAKKMDEITLQTGMQQTNPDLTSKHADVKEVDINTDLSEVLDPISQATKPKSSLPSKDPKAASGVSKTTNVIKSSADAGKKVYNYSACANCNKTVNDYQGFLTYICTECPNFHLCKPCWKAQVHNKHRLQLHRLTEPDRKKLFCNSCGFVFHMSNPRYVLYTCGTCKYYVMCPICAEDGMHEVHADHLQYIKFYVKTAFCWYKDLKSNMSGYYVNNISAAHES